jgi:hypothetical protein
MDSISEAKAPEAMQLLRNLFPAEMNSPASTDTDQSSWWTPEEIAIARLTQVKRLMQNGWKTEANGLLTKGRATIRPSSPIPCGAPGELGYNPRTQAFALRLGATFIESGPWAGRYRLGEHVVDRLGCFVDTEACPECGSRQGEFRFKVRAVNPNPFAKPWEQVFTYCRRCCTQDEIDELKRPKETAEHSKAKAGSR